MKIETVMPFVKIGAALLLGTAAGSAATVAYKPAETKCQKVEVNCTHPTPPPLKIELICPKK